jgi:hypothetical protein
MAQRMVPNCHLDLFQERVGLTHANHSLSQMPFCAKDYCPPPGVGRVVPSSVLVDPRPARWLRDSLMALGRADTYAATRTLWETVELSVDHGLRTANRFPANRDSLRAVRAEFFNERGRPDLAEAFASLQQDLLDGCLNRRLVPTTELAEKWIARVSQFVAETEQLSKSGLDPRQAALMAKESQP